MCVVGGSSSFGLASRLSEKLDDVGGMFIFFVIFVVLRKKFVITQYTFLGG